MFTTSGISSTISSWFNYGSRKRGASQLETPPKSENADPNIPLNPRKKLRCAIPRRSELISKKIRKRLFVEPKEKKIHSFVRSSFSKSLGPMEILPNEILHLIFSLLDRQSLVRLSFVSKDLNNRVISYILSSPGLKHILCYNQVQYQPIYYKEAGDILRKVSAIKTLRQHLKIATQITIKIKPLCDKVIQSGGITLAYKCFGGLFYHYISSWSEYDKLRAYCFIEKHTRLNKKIRNVLKLNPGTQPWQECILRQLVQSTLLEPSYSDAEYGFWLNQLLKGLPLTHQARLLYIFTGPTDNAGFIFWSACQCTSPTHNREMGTPSGERDFKGLAKALRVLLVERNEWNMDAIISVFDEMTTTPTGWCLGQVATLLMLSGKDVTQAILGNRAINGHIMDLSVVSYYLAHACVKEDKANGNNDKLKWFLEVIQYATSMMSSEQDKTWFAYSLIHHWQCYLTSLFEEEEMNDEIFDFEEMHEEFMKSLNCLTQLSTMLLTQHTLSNPVEH